MPQLPETLAQSTVAQQTENLAQSTQQPESLAQSTIPPQPENLAQSTIP